MAARAPANGTSGGYDYQFVKTPSDMLICAVCFLPSKQPCLSECCGHTFCKSCLEGSKKFSNICPVCRSEEFATMFNKQADRVIRSLHVFCTNKEQGCEWQGEVNDVNGHLGNCLFQVIYCPYECGGCSQRQHLTSHIEMECPRRTVSCQYCNEVGEYQFIEGQHKEVCPKFPVQCPNECEIETIHRDKVEEHREVCPLEMIQCDYHVVGCKVKMARKDMNTHKQEMMEVHLSLSINELMENKMQLKSTQNNLKHEAEKTKDDLTQQLVWHTTKIADTEQQLMATQQEAKKTKDGLTQRIVLVENQFSSTNNQLTTVQQAANMQLENLRQQLSASQLEVKNVTAQLTASQQEARKTKDQLLQKLTATEKELNTTKQQLATTCQNLTKAEKEHTTLAASTDKALTEMENKFQAKITEVMTAAEQKITELQASLQQKTQLSWFLFLHQVSKLSSGLGDRVVPVVVKMTEFTKNVKGNGWLSQPFYDTHNKQCKLQLKVVASKIDEVIYLSVLLLGDHEAHNKHMPSPTDWFSKIFLKHDDSIVKLLNQISDDEHIEGHLKYKSKLPLHIPVVVDPNTLYYNIKFISYTDLHRNTATRQYLKDDTLFFEVCKI